MQAWKSKYLAILNLDWIVKFHVYFGSALWHCWQEGLLAMQIYCNIYFVIIKLKWLIGYNWNDWLVTTEMIDWLQLKWLIGYNWNDWLATTSSGWSNSTMNVPYHAMNIWLLSDHAYLAMLRLKFIFYILIQDFSTLFFCSPYGIPNITWYRWQNLSFTWK